VAALPTTRRAARPTLAQGRHRANRSAKRIVDKLDSSACVPCLRGPRARHRVDPVDQLGRQTARMRHLTGGGLRGCGVWRASKKGRGGGPVGLEPQACVPLRNLRDHRPAGDHLQVKKPAWRGRVLAFAARSRIPRRWGLAVSWLGLAASGWSGPWVGALASAGGGTSVVRCRPPARARASAAGRVGISRVAKFGRFGAL
jgi:hypothetical protein